MEIFPGGSGLSPSKEVNKGDIIIIIILVYVPKGTHDNGVTKRTAAEREKREGIIRTQFRAHYK